MGAGRFGSAAAMLLCLLAAAGPVHAGISFTVAVGGDGGTGRLAALGQLTVFPTLVTNTGDVADTYTVTISKDLPGPWIASLCQGSICYAPFVQEISFALAPGAGTNLDIDLTPAGTVGEGSVLVTVTSDGDPLLSRSERFLVITPGLDLLLVDGDGDTGGETAYRDALAAAGRTCGTWPRHTAGTLDGLQLEGFAHVVWFSGAHAPGLVDADRAALAYYLQHGGALFLAGPDLAREACDPASVHFSAQAAAWFPVVLGTGYGGEAATPATAAGPTGDPFTGALSCSLQGPGGLNSACDLLAPGRGTASLLYPGGGVAAVRAIYGAGRSFCCAFALEDVSPAQDRTALLQAFLAWAAAPSAVPPAGPGTVVASVSAFPNPCNPRTLLRFSLAAGGNRAVVVDILDLRGRVVRRLLRADLGPGEHTLPWSGDDDAGHALASGVYLVRVEADRAVAHGKIMVTK